jgi:hypothetical protein
MEIVLELKEKVLDDTIKKSSFYTNILDIRYVSSHDGKKAYPLYTVRLLYNCKNISNIKILGRVKKGKDGNIRIYQDYTLNKSLDSHLGRLTRTCECLKNSNSCYTVVTNTVDTRVSILCEDCLKEKVINKLVGYHKKDWDAYKKISSSVEEIEYLNKELPTNYNLSKLEDVLANYIYNMEKITGFDIKEKKDELNTLSWNNASVPESYYTLAKEAISKLMNIKNNSGDFITRLRILASQEWVSYKDRNIIPYVYLNSISMNDKSEFILNVGECFQGLEVKYVKRVSKYGKFGSYFNYTFKDLQDNIILYCNSKDYVFSSEKAYLLDGKIKNHSEFGNIKYNIIKLDNYREEV